MAAPLLSMMRQLRHHDQGSTVVEFAIVVPILVSMLMFLFDAGHQLYVSSILSGEINAAARASTLETASAENREALDAHVSEQVQRLVPNGELTYSRKAYKSYARAQAVAEAFNDTNGDGICNLKEEFDDVNGNGVRDMDSGLDGNGGARDVVIYTATLTYDRLFPLAGLVGLDDRVSMSSTAILRNQPFDGLVDEAKIGRCP